MTNKDEEQIGYHYQSKAKVAKTTAIEVEPTPTPTQVEETNTNANTTNKYNQEHEFHMAKCGEEFGVTETSTSSSQDESIEGYDSELMGGRTLLTAEEEKKLLRKIDWRLMTLCSLMFLFKNLDSKNVCITIHIFSTGQPLIGRDHPVSMIYFHDPFPLTMYFFVDFECTYHEQRNRSKCHDTIGNFI